MNQRPLSDRLISRDSLSASDTFAVAFIARLPMKQRRMVYDLVKPRLTHKGIRLIEKHLLPEVAVA